MSVASRARAQAYVKRVNAATPEWARDQIMRQGTIRSLYEKYKNAPAASIEKLNFRVAYAHAMTEVAVTMKAYFSKRRPELSKVQLKTKP